MYYQPVKASCVASVINLGEYYKSILISHTGGVISKKDNFNLWVEEIEYSIDIEDIFDGYALPPKKKGFYVWEGELTPVVYDQPIFNGTWRPATKKIWQRWYRK